MDSYGKFINVLGAILSNSFDGPIPRTPGLHYASIDGLRAFAVVAVVLFHAGFGLSGGYVGVDVFFVISGYLITGRVHEDLLAGKFRFVDFWERRVRRLAPAWILMVFLVLVCGWITLLQSDFLNLGKAGLFQSFFLSNVYSLFDSGYFDGSSAEKPLLHLWSLAVEEQFYLVLPVVLWYIHRKGGGKPVTYHLQVLGILFVLSLVVSSIGVFWKPRATFYLLPTRAWELLAGSCLAVAKWQPLMAGKRLVREAFGIAGLGLILASAVLFSSATVFPGATALVPVLGSVLVIMGTVSTGEEGVDTLAGRLLSLKPIVFVGLISYSLYLWHWPLIVFSKELLLEPISNPGMILVVLVALVVATLSWRYVELPFRHQRVAKGRQILWFMSVGLGFLAIASGAIVAFDGVRARWPERVYSYLDARSDAEFPPSAGLSDVQAGRIVPIGKPAEKSAPEVLLWGDSHANAIAPAIHRYLDERNLTGGIVSYSANAPVLGWYRYTGYDWSLGAHAPEYNQAVVDYAVAHKVRTVLLVGGFSAYARAPSVNGRTFATALEDTVQYLVGHGIAVWFFFDVPTLSVDVPRLLVRSEIYGLDLKRYLLRPDLLNDQDGIPESTIARIRSFGAHTINLKEAFLSPTGDFYEIARSGRSLYFDGNHLTKWAAENVVLPYLEKELRLE